MSEFDESVFVSLWKSQAPSKEVTFSWALLLDCVPTRSNLAIAMY